MKREQSPLMELGRLKEEWTVTDWMDFWVTLNEFAARLLERHRLEHK